MSAESRAEDFGDKVVGGKLFLGVCGDGRLCVQDTYIIDLHFCRQGGYAFACSASHIRRGLAGKQHIAVKGTYSAAAASPRFFSVNIKYIVFFCPPQSEGVKASVIYVDVFVYFSIALCFLAITVPVNKAYCKLLSI